MSIAVVPFADDILELVALTASSPIAEATENTMSNMHSTLNTICEALSLSIDNIVDFYPCPALSVGDSCGISYPLASSIMPYFSN
jgi:DNA-binding Xre family transcriptional regulator